MKRYIILFGMAVICLFLTGCARKYTIGKNPKLEDITSLGAGGGDGMTYSSQWSYRAVGAYGSKSAYIEYMYWDEDVSDMIEGKIDITDDEYLGIVKLLDGCRYVKRKSVPKNVLDGPGGSNLYVNWPKSPGGSYGVENTSDYNAESNIVTAIIELKNKYDGGIK